MPASTPIPSARQGTSPGRPAPSRPAGHARRRPSGPSTPARCWRLAELADRRHTSTPPSPPRPRPRPWSPAFNSGFLMTNANGDYYTDSKTIRALRNSTANILTWDHGAAVPPGRGGGPAEPGPADRPRQADPKTEPGRHHPVGLHPGQHRLRLALGPGHHRRRRAGLRRRSRPQHHHAGRHPGPRRSGPGHGTRHQHRLGRLRGLPAAQRVRPGCPANGTNPLPGMYGGPDRYFATWWSRDFITMSARTTAQATAKPGR